MASEPKTRISQDPFLDALHSEVAAGTENLNNWIDHIHVKGGSALLFELETWLRGLLAFFEVRNLPMSLAERTDLVHRSFAPEIKITRHVVMLCERLATGLANFGQPKILEFEDFIENQMRKDKALDYDISKILQQPTPLESLAQLMDSLSDLRVLIDAMRDKREPNSQVFQSLGRRLQQDLKGCRYIDMMLTQRLKLHFDRLDQPKLRGVLAAISEENLRQSAAVILLYLFRFLLYLDLVERDLKLKQCPRHSLVIFALLHEEMEKLSEFVKSRLHKGRGAGHSLWNAAELMLYSLRIDSVRAQERELIFLSLETEPPRIYSKIESGQGLLRNCFENCVVTLVQAIDKDFDGRQIFPQLVDRFHEAQKLRRDLWDLRQYMKDVLDKRVEFNLDTMMTRVTEFRESSLPFLMYRDWEEFQRFSDSTITASNPIELRTLLRKFVSFLETLVQEVSKRGILHETALVTGQ